MTEPLLIATSQQTGTAGRTDGVGNITIAALHTVVRNGIQIRRGNIFATIETHIGVALIIGHDDDEIGRAIGDCAGTNGGFQRNANERRDNDSFKPTHVVRNIRNVGRGKLI